MKDNHSSDIQKLKKEGKIKEKNFERKKPINPNK